MPESVHNPFVRHRDGQEALDFFKSEGAFVGHTVPAPVVLLLDINMPRIDGIQVLTELRSWSSTEDMPIIMLTTTDNQVEIQRCYELGCNVYIPKPVAADAFIDAIQKLGFFLQVVRLPGKVDSKS